ncbi:hypothetical protein BpHYR1_046151 [Brachionus plicatilis]|uniref:Uncharacterized protein n=1 Tax=Brachionus plicatilis TaxID=10195 RepID=A0A3M7P281_BRAPC|nr:hypothetical protein BpHYR1_046151 [Brachionus plicatilis]
MLNKSRKLLVFSKEKFESFYNLKIKETCTQKQRSSWKNSGTPKKIDEATDENKAQRELPGNKATCSLAPQLA